MVEMFEPKLRVEQGADNILALHATTPTPNDCYSAGQASIQDTPAKGRFGIPEARYVTLPLQYSDGPCTQAITTVHHRLGIPYLPGQNLISATVTLDGKELGSATVQLPEPDETSGGQEFISIGDITAWVNTQPPGDPILYVEATVMIPHTGYEVTLEPSDEVQQSEKFHLQLEATESAEPSLPVVRKRSVRFERTGVSPETVIIHLPDGSTTTTEVMTAA